MWNSSRSHGHRELGVFTFSPNKCALWAGRALMIGSKCGMPCFNSLSPTAQAIAGFASSAFHRNMAGNCSKLSQLRQRRRSPYLVSDVFCHWYVQPNLFKHCYSGRDEFCPSIIYQLVSVLVLRIGAHESVSAKGVHREPSIGSWRCDLRRTTPTSSSNSPCHLFPDESTLDFATCARH